MKQQFDQVSAGAKAPATSRSTRLASPPTAASHPGKTVVTPAPTSGAWLSEALKLWCTEPHAAR